jgi:lactate dehydrogenase-like 2-hydroxyacid dehydrogenase
MGGIGRNMAKKALAFGMTIRYHNRKPLGKEIEKECQAEYRGFEDLLQESDVLSLNLPLNVSFRCPILPICPLIAVSIKIS